MEINNLIVRLLLANEYLAIKNLGIFRKEFQAAYIHPVSHVASPAHYSLKFEQNQNQTDEILENEISLFMQISKNEAADALQKFVDSIYTDLNAGKKYTLKNIGHLVYKQGNTIVFEQDTLFNFHTAAFGLKPVIASPVNKSSEVQNTTETIAVNEIPPVKKNQEKVEIPVKIELKEEKIVVKEVIAEEEKIQQVQEIPDVPKPKSEESKPQVITKPENKKSLKWIWYVSAAILIIGLAGFAYVFKDTILSKFENKTIENLKDTVSNAEQIAKMEESQVQNQNLDSLMTAEENFDNQVIESEQNPSKYSTDNQKPYLLVAGCFKSESNAQNYADELIKKGFTAELIGQTSGMNRVCFGSYFTKEEANQMLKEVSSKGFKGAWVQFDPQ